MGQRDRGQENTASDDLMEHVHKNRITDSVCQSGRCSTLDFKSSRQTHNQRSTVTMMVTMMQLEAEMFTMRPSRASTSRTRVPLARPPMLGLQLISPMLAAGAGVINSVEAPRLAAAAAASQPAQKTNLRFQSNVLQSLHGTRHECSRMCCCAQQVVPEQQRKLCCGSTCMATPNDDYIHASAGCAG